MRARLMAALLLSLCALPLGPRPAAHAATPAAQLPVCGRLLSVNGPGSSPPVLHVGARPLRAAVSERTGRTFVALSGQRGSGGAGKVGCRSSVTTVDTGLGRFIRRVAVGVIPASIAVDDQDGRVFVTGYDEAGYPAHSTPALIVLNTQGQVIRPATPFSPCPCAGSASGMLSTAIDGSIHRVYVITLESVITFDTLTGTRLATVPADVNGSGGIPNYAVDTRHHRLFVATGAGVTVVDGRTGALAQSINLGQSERVLDLDTRTGRVFVVEGSCRGGQGGPTQGGVIVLDAATGKQVARAFGCDTSLSILADSPARRVLTGLPGAAKGQKYGVLDAASGRVLGTVTTSVPLFYERTAVEPGNGRVYVDTGNGSIQVLDPRTWHEAGRISLPRGSSGFLTISSRPSRLIVTDPYHGTVTILPLLGPLTG